MWGLILMSIKVQGSDGPKTLATKRNERNVMRMGLTPTKAESSIQLLIGRQGQELDKIFT